MPELLKAPVTPAQQARDTLLGALVGLARATTNEPKTDDTDEVLNAGLRLAAQPDAPEERLQRMLAIVQTEKHRVAPGCATCAMPCGNTNDYDFVRLWAAPESIRTLKLQMSSGSSICAHSAEAYSASWKGISGISSVQIIRFFLCRMSLHLLIRIRIIHVLKYLLYFRLFRFS